MENMEVVQMIRSRHGLELVPARTAWDMLTRSLVVSDIVEVIRQDLEKMIKADTPLIRELELDMNPERLGKLFAAVLPILLRCQIEVVIDPTSSNVGCINSNGVITLFEPLKVQDPIESNDSSIGGIRPLLRKMSPTEIYQYVKSKMKWLIPAKRQKRNANHSNNAGLTNKAVLEILNAMKEQVQAEPAPAWTPTILAAVLIHEVLHLALEHCRTGEKYREIIEQNVAWDYGLEEPVAKWVANQILNVFFDNEIHEIAESIKNWVTLAIRLRKNESPIQLVLVIDGSESGSGSKNKSGSHQYTTEGGVTEPKEKDKNADSEKKKDVINEGCGNPQAAALAERKKIAQLLQKSARDAGTHSYITELILEWEKEECDPLNELVKEITSAAIETIGGLVRVPEDSVYPDPTERYLIKSGKLNRNLPSRDYQYGHAHVLAVCDTSGSMSVEEIARCLSAITSIGNVFLTLLLCDVQPVVISEMELVGPETIKERINRQGAPRGGTQLGNAVAYCANKPWWRTTPPNLIVYLTDGYNYDWAEKIIGEIPVVVVLTTDNDLEIPKNWKKIRFVKN